MRIAVELFKLKMELNILIIMIIMLLNEVSSVKAEACKLLVDKNGLT